MPLAPWTRLGPYEILEPIGAGGMGEVYKARDTRLDRIVAIKVSKENFSDRFEREARAVASLNHPHICTLHDVGPNYLVMEYIEGTPLKGPLLLGEALRLAGQIAGALDAAHRKGITHRDLKPGNILVTKAGVKLLDFGLAKVAPAMAAAGSNTETFPLTDVGVILGTLQYMSPEQIEGREADARSDIFSVGLVLYELLAGTRAFSASTQAGLMAAILKEEPRPLTSLQPLTPPALDRTVSKCLAKDPDDRWQSARDLKAELDWIATGNSVPDLTRPPRAVSRRSMFPWIAGAAAAGAAAGAGLAAWAWRGKSSPAMGAIRHSLFPPEGTRLERNFTRQSLALSPVGGRVAMIATNEQGSMIWVQRMDSLTASPIQGTEGATIVFWSPDAEFIGFWAGGKLKKIPAGGGTSLPICDLFEAWSAAWNEDGIIVAAGAARISSHISVKSGEQSPGKPLRWPKFLPGGKHLLYVNPDRKIGGSRAYVAEWSTGRETELMPTDTRVTFTPDQPGSSQGYLLFGRGATLLAQRFDMDQLRTSGEPEPVAKDVPFFMPSSWSEFDASADGVLIYSAGSQKAQLTWVDRRGQELNAVSEPKEFFGFLRLSQDGKKLAADVFDFSKGATDIWTFDLSQPTAELVTFEAGGTFGPVWSPDGTRIAYAGAPALQLAVKAVGDRGRGEGFPPGAKAQFPSDWSADWIFYTTSGGDEKGDIWLASVTDRKLVPLRQTQFDSALPTLSPNGAYLAFSANDSSRHEIYVQRLQGGDSPKLTGAPKRVSIDGGNGPRWRRDGKEIFFLSPDRQIMAAPVKYGTEIECGTPTIVFRLPTSYHSLAPVTVGYEVSPDGQRFLVPIRKAAVAPLQVVVNWQALLKK